MRSPWRRPGIPPIAPLAGEVRVTAKPAVARVTEAALRRAAAQDAWQRQARPEPYALDDLPEFEHRDRVVQRKLPVPTPRRVFADDTDPFAPRPFQAGTITSLPSPRDPFEELVRTALNELPQQFLDTLDDVPVVISESGAAFGAYGLYRGAGIINPGQPAQITIFRDTLTRDFGHDPVLLAWQVRRVVRHELGHHLGFDEVGVARLGL